jgi:eukaryotic-like serine/threonine-protein kinase
MPLASGTRIGPYTVSAAIGAGGMGEVYRARDTRLERDVALKVLPQNVSGDAERLQRLQREARTLAALNHPNIAHVYGLENADGVTAFAMELVEGATLEDRIAAGAIPIDDAVRIARQIADALEAAHEQGIVHRDLKPANIKIRPDGTVKVLDFGLARAVEPAPDSSASLMPTITSPAMTGVGVILGTAAYMSPEQAKGQPVDRRADIWAFGVVLAEMLSGKRMFGGDTVSEVLASVIKDAPAIPEAPPAIARLIARCLQRDPRARLRDIGEARIVLEDPASIAWPASPSGASSRAATSRAAWAVAAAAALIAGIAIGWLARPASPATEVPRRTFTLPADNLIHGTSRTPQISPDGTKVVYSSGGRGRLWVRDLATSESRAIVEGDARYYSWSPDSTQVAYLTADGRLMKAGVAGGTPGVVAVLGQQLGADAATAWTTDGSIVVTTSLPGTGLQRVAADGGDLSTILTPAAGAEQDFHDVTALPEGRGLLYVLDRTAGIVDTIMVLAGGSPKRVLQLEGERLRAPRYASTGHLLFERAGSNPGIWAVPFSLDDLTPTGEPFLVVPRGGFPSVSVDGTLMFMPPAVASSQELAWIDRTGAVVETVGRPLQGLTMPALSPDGRLVAAVATEEERTDIWVFDTVRDTQTRLTFGDADESLPSWSPSGDQVLFSRATPPRQTRAIAAQPADGTGQSRVIVESQFATASAMSHDGKFIAFSQPGPDAVKTGPAIWFAPADESAAPRVFTDDAGSQSEPRFSPDGRYLAYQSAESGRLEVYVKPFPGGDGKWQVSTNGGVTPRWSRRGNRLLFVQPGAPNRIMEADVSTAAAFVVGTPREVLDFTKVERYAGGWDVNADATRFLVIRQSADAPRLRPQMTVIQNWFAEFKNRRP